MNKIKPVFSVDYTNESLDERSENKIPYVVKGAPKFVSDELLHGKKALYLPIGAAVGYLLNNDFYDCLSNEMTLEILFRLESEQNHYVNIILGNHIFLAGFSLFEDMTIIPLGGISFSVCTYSSNVLARLLEKNAYYIRNSWNHCICTFRQGVVFLYVNGSLIASSIGNGDVSGEIVHPSSPNQILFVGGNVKDGDLDLTTDANVSVGFVNIFNNFFENGQIKKRYKQVKKFMRKRCENDIKEF